jgi:hypothetical protein
LPVQHLFRGATVVAGQGMNDLLTWTILFAVVLALVLLLVAIEAP